MEENIVWEEGWNSDLVTLILVPKERKISEMSSVLNLMANILTLMVLQPVYGGSRNTVAVSINCVFFISLSVTRYMKQKLHSNRECIIICTVLMKDRCKLFCRVSGTSSYYQLKDRVTDGTSCGPETDDLCVQGLCRVWKKVNARFIIASCQIY